MTRQVKLDIATYALGGASCFAPIGLVAGAACGGPVGAFIGAVAFTGIGLVLGLGAKCINESKVQPTPGR